MISYNPSCKVEIATEGQCQTETLATVSTIIIQLEVCLVKTFVIKRQTKIAADDTLIFYFYLSKKIRLDFPCESSA